MNTNHLITFLANLEQNNNKPWFDANKAEYESAKKNFYDIVDKFIAGIAKFDQNVEGLLAKQCVFRIHRDIRFSNDKAPYKNWFGAYIAARGLPMRGGWMGKRSLPFKADAKGGHAYGAANPLPGYYVHLQPGGSIIAGGLHLPSAGWLTAARQRISGDGDILWKIITAKKFKEIWGEFLGERLKKAPRGFAPDDKYIDLIRLKSFDLVHNYNDNYLADCEGFIQDALNKFQLLKPVNDFFNVAVASGSC